MKPRPDSISATEPAERIEQWLTGRRYVVQQVDVLDDLVYFECDRDPSDDVRANYVSQPTPKDVAQTALQTALTEMRAIPEAQRTAEQRAWLAWAIVHSFE